MVWAMMRTPEGFDETSGPATRQLQAFLKCGLLNEFFNGWGISTDEIAAFHGFISRHTNEKAAPEDGFAVPRKVP
jgi:hypothetical protein